MDMKIVVNYKSRAKTIGNIVRILLPTDIEVTDEVMQKSILTLLAELGGYLGMTIGVSLLDLRFLVKMLATFYVRKIGQNGDATL